MKFIIYALDSGKVIQRLESTPEAAARLAEHLGAAFLQSDNETATRVDHDGTLVTEVPEAAPVRIRYSFNQWCDRFPMPTQVAMVQAAMTNAQAKLIYDRAMAAEFIDPLDPRTIASTNAWVAMGVMTQAEADAALAA